MYMANNMANKYIYINHKPKIDNSELLLALLAYLHFLLYLCSRKKSQDVRLGNFLRIRIIDTYHF